MLRHNYYNYAHLRVRNGTISEQGVNESTMSGGMEQSRV